jgi:hypothetical protein
MVKNNARKYIIRKNAAKRGFTKNGFTKNGGEKKDIFAKKLRQNSKI